MLVTTAPFFEHTGFSGVNRSFTSNLSMNHFSLARASSPDPAMAPAWPTARVRFAFQRPTTQATTGFSKATVLFVVAARLGVQHRCLGAFVVGHGKGEFGSGVIDVDILAAGDQRRRPPAADGKIVCDRGGEVAGVGIDGDGAFAQTFRPDCLRQVHRRCVYGSTNPLRQGSCRRKYLRRAAGRARVFRAHHAPTIFSVRMITFSTSGLMRINSATPSRTAEGGR